jgi:hypothetical protein
VAKEEMNKMSVENINIVITPNLLWDPGATETGSLDRPKIRFLPCSKIPALEIFILHCVASSWQTVFLLL